MDGTLSINRSCDEVITLPVLGQIAELRGANGSKVLRVREQDRPTVADPFVKADWPVCGFGGENRGLRH